MQESKGLYSDSKMQDQHEGAIPPAEFNPDIELEPWQREAVGLLRAIRLVQKKADSEMHGFDGGDVLAIHGYVLNDPFNPHFSGRLRKVIVKIGSTVRGEYREAKFIPVHPKDLPDMFENFSTQLKNKTDLINGSTPVSEVLDTSAWSHFELIKMHPFIDGNGRTARLLCDYIFKKAGLPYLVDWGSKDDEYTDVVDKTYGDENPDLFKTFLARKLFERTFEVSALNPGLTKLMTSIRNDTEDYLNSLSQNVS
ncbi:MAG: Fic family protein [Candidatus Curtissbacteria bacterium]|nr:Fic family protein [Candidatus Curtissbacteria bacterium]